MIKQIRFLFILLLNLTAFDTLACSCLAESTEQRYSKASEVFVGTVVETQLMTKNEGFDDTVRATISINKTIKGSPTEPIELLDSVVDGANCGVGLLTGRKYLVYLYGDKSISICGGTKLYNEFSDKEVVDQMLSY